MTLPPRRFDYAPINDRPIIKWPNNARVAFWVAPNMEFFEYLPENRPTQPDIPRSTRAWITATASASGACSTC
jgi:allantoinase